MLNRMKLRKTTQTKTSDKYDLVPTTNELLPLYIIRRSPEKKVKKRLVLKHTQSPSVYFLKSCHQKKGFKRWTVFFPLFRLPGHSLPRIIISNVGGLFRYPQKSRRGKPPIQKKSRTKPSVSGRKSRWITKEFYIANIF